MPYADEMPPREYWDWIGGIIGGRVLAYQDKDFCEFLFRDGNSVYIMPPVAHAIALLSVTLGDVLNVSNSILTAAEEFMAEAKGNKKLTAEANAEYKRLRRQLNSIHRELPALFSEMVADED